MDNEKIIFINDDTDLVEFLRLANKELIIKSEIYARSNLVQTNKSTYSLVLQALDRATVRLKPRKPIMLNSEFGDKAECCPRCKNHIVNVWNKIEYKPNYCHYCGQKLDWEKEKKDA